MNVFLYILGELQPYIYNDLLSYKLIHNNGYIYQLLQTNLATHGTNP
jgi:hypothetical protein